ncbi:2-oxo acid dehydrogenase subunit E2 [Umezawaea beigongshangensis]|uniref:2-oxo acid dehydrogenase subunit E2 n=1 Tax=Umezawaea beigongshangensis TaxID=2780383 RepID=UPI0018F1BF1C|nr:2-oxo acid dehydrogenase subunit E2 [Umezawaea beigongshangensis]
MRALAPRVVEGLNGALHRLFAERPALHLLGEDVLDPYGGAFKVTRGLSTAHPDRVLTTPLSEAGITGVAAGLALSGDQVVVEMMFGDFAALAFDQLLNLVSKSVTMYGHRVPMPVVVRCPVGGGRGYGPTHSQSVQKHFVGIPNLSLYETTPFHDPYLLLSHALDHGPSVLFEDKVLYTRRSFTDGVVDEHLRYTVVGAAPGWAHVAPADGSPADVVLLCPGGVAHRAVEAAGLLRDRGIAVHLLVPGRLYPLDLDEVLPLIAGARLVAVAEESTEGGTWGAEVAAHVHRSCWQDLRAPVLMLSSADSIVPTAPHLEARVLLGAQRIAEEVAAAVGTVPGVVSDAVPDVVPGAVPDAAPEAEAVGVPVTAPKLNNNDETYVLLEWLVAEGERVAEGAPLVELETSKAVEEIAAPASGYVRASVAAGTEVPVGAVLAHLVPTAPAATAAPPAAPVPPAAQTAPAPAPAPVAERSRTRVLDRVQQGIAAVVTRAHREVPAAFAALEVGVDHAIERLRALSEETGGEIGLAEAVVKAVAAARPAFPTLFGTLVDERTVALADTADVAVTVDTGTGLYTPVLRDCANRSVEELADDLMDFRLKALRGEFTARELDGGTIGVSLNLEPGVLVVSPIVLWPQLCMVSVSGPIARVLPVDGAPVVTTVVTLGLAHDHRVVNGREAVAFLRAVADSLCDPHQLDDLLRVTPADHDHRD